MELVEVSENPAPPVANVAAIRAVDGMVLRVARWHPDGHSIGTVVVCQGRAEFVEKYFETVSDLLQRGLTVVVFDWRGQGFSGRELANLRKGHIDDFSLYERDLDAILEQVLLPFCPRPWFALGHSMGAAVLLRQSRGGRSPFERMVLTAPLIDINGLRFPGLARFIAKFLDLAGIGGAFIPGGGETAMLTKPFRNNLLTFDSDRYERNNRVVAAAPQVAIGDPTIGWLDAAFAQIDEFAAPEYPRKILTPCLVFAADNDRVVDGAALEKFATQLKAGRLVTLSPARHEILMERDNVREQFWAAFDAFVPGTREDANASADEPPMLESLAEENKLAG